VNKDGPAAAFNEKMKNYKGEEQVGMPPRKDDRPAPKKEDAPH
jgi:hypothetical protein